VLIVVVENNRTQKQMLLILARNLAGRGHDVRVVSAR
jgi:hypothetical protein